MANPQKENGYTSIANEILEQIYGRRFSLNQLKILLMVIRYTYGFSRKTAKMSNGFIASGTGIHEVNVSKEINALISDCVLSEKERPTFSKPRVIGFNKNYESWRNHQELANLGGVSKSANMGVSKSAKKGLANPLTKKEKEKKEKEKKEKTAPAEPEWKPINTGMKYREF